MRAEQILAALARKHAAPAWAFLGNVRNGTGFARKVQRYADAVAMSLYPSRGLELHGFEIKVDRGDWLRELKDPEKSAEIQAYCNRWWVATPPDLVKPGELPPTWGLVTVTGQGVRVATCAPALEPKPLDRPMVAALLRRATEDMTPKASVEADITARVDAAVEKRLKSNDATAEWQRDDARRELDALRKAVAAFEAASGVQIDRYDGKRIGEAVALVRYHNLEALASRYDGLANEEARMAERHREIAAGIKAASGKLREAESEMRRAPAS